MRSILYIQAKRKAIAWLQKDGCEIQGDVPLVDVVRELDKRLAITIKGELDKKFAADIVNRIFAFGDEPLIKRRPKGPSRDEWVACFDDLLGQGEIEQFYNLMQAYRHHPVSDPAGTLSAFLDVKAFLGKLAEQIR